MARYCRLLSAREARGLDIKIREVFGISTLLLMENAGRGIAEEAIKMLRPGDAVAIFCGRGNNGGDGFVAARHLLAKGIMADIFLAGKARDVRNEAGTNLAILLNLKRRVVEVDKKNIYIVRKRVSKYALIIDALLGIGLQGGVEGIIRDLIVSINSSRAYILSVDIPSGLDATTGKILGSSIKADKTVTFLAKKRGMAIGYGPKACGRVVVKDLGFPYIYTDRKH